MKFICRTLGRKLEARSAYLSLCLENAPTNCVLRFLLLSEQQILGLLSRDEERLADAVRLLQLLVGQELELLAVLQPAVVSARVAGHSQRIYLVGNARAILVQCQLLAINVFCFAFILDINLQLESDFNQFVQLAPRCLWTMQKSMDDGIRKTFLIELNESYV